MGIGRGSQGPQGPQSSDPSGGTWELIVEGPLEESLTMQGVAPKMVIDDG